jgi:FkbM family methyltransferase
MLSSPVLRSWVRRLGLTRVLHPVVEWMEHRRAGKLADYSVKDLGDGVELMHEGRSVVLMGLPKAQCDLALSEHERPIMATMLSKVKPGAVVWDVGANVGFYTRLLAELTGQTGKVFAFEPNTKTFDELAANTAALSAVTRVCKGLSDEPGTVQFATPVDHSSASRIVGGSTVAMEEMMSIEIVRGDDLVSRDGIDLPQFIKLDVEGHELHALKGMRQVLADDGCKAVLVEVHFTLLEQNGEAGAPVEIAGLLRAAGLRRQTWVARSHLLAERE